MSFSSGQAGSSKDPNGKGMDWMYKGPAALVDRDDYLTGRQVDKALNILNEAEKGNSYSYLDDVQKDLTPVSIFANPRTQGPIDVIRKIKEDPLYQIQKKEEENLKQLLNNPVKMKQLREMAEKKKLEDSQPASSAKSKRAKKGESSSSSSSSSGDSEDEKDIDKLLAEKLRAMKEGKDLLQSKKNEDDDRRSSGKRKYDERYESSSRRSEHQDRNLKYDRDQDRDRSESGRRDRDDRRDSKYSRPSSSSGSSSSRRPEPERKKIDESEKERRLREMMENAKWRDSQRSQNVSKQREEMKREEERLKKAEKDSDFIRKQLVQAADTGSVEKRIKSNSYNIQRSKSSMDQNFARR